MIKKKDFVELEYTGKISENDIVFDTTDEKLAKEKGLYQEGVNYGSIVVCVGEGHVLKGLDKDLEGKEVGKSYEVSLGPEDAFGKKDAKLLKIVPSNVFKKNNINAVPGLQVNMDGVIGTIKTVNGGRTVVDFNHPFSGKEISYSYTVKRVLDDDVEKAKSFLILALNAKPEGFELNLKDDVLEIKTKTGVNLDEPAKGLISSKLVALLDNVKSIKFI